MPSYYNPCINSTSMMVSHSTSALLGAIVGGVVGAAVVLLVVVGALCYVLGRRSNMTTAAQHARVDGSVATAAQHARVDAVVPAAVVNNDTYSSVLQLPAATARKHYSEVSGADELNMMNAEMISARYV
jgi:phospholipase/lecithinase/hemolysin